MKIRNIVFCSLALIVSCSFFHCQAAPQDKESVNAPQLSADGSTADNDPNKLVRDTSQLMALIQDLEVRELPFYDSTNFDNVAEYEPLSADWIRFLGLEQIYPHGLKTVDKVWIRERVNISERFISLILGVQPGDSELFTSLVNFSKDYAVIDFATIAYDEIAEGCMRTESYLKKGKISTYASDFCYQEKTDTTELVLQSNGLMISDQ